MILSIETATPVCSICVAQNGKLIAEKQSAQHENHGDVLTQLIADLLAENQLSPKDLKAVSISAGPGSYSGLRIGFSAAKGLCFALNIPLITISSLQSLYASYLVSKQYNIEKYYFPAIDAGRMEIYAAGYFQNQHILNDQPLECDENSFSAYPPANIEIFGYQVEKLKILYPHFTILNILPSAKGQIQIAFHHFENKNFADLAYSEPSYLKAYQAKVSKPLL
jgi:tRNA threonylcarbamoyladenosine biosynthesis protein TsaB